MSDSTIQRPKLVLVQPASLTVSESPAPELSAALRARHIAYSNILKSSSHVQSYDPVELVSLSKSTSPHQQLILEGLNQNLNHLKHLQGRLRFMISEVEGLVLESR